VTGRDGDRIEGTVADIRADGGHAVGVQADLGSAEEADRLFAAAHEGFGRLDALVNNAAWVTPRTHLLELDEEHWETALRTNLTSVYRCATRAARTFVSQGGGGSIVSISSLGGSLAHRMMAAYDTSKGGLEAFTRAAALDLAPFRIRVNAVCPGWVQDEHFDSLDEEIRQRRSAAVPLGRLGLPSEVAAAAAFLSSERASYITGQVLGVDGGIGVQLRSPGEDVPLPGSLSHV
jgi:NAD(P)-dependent dehydrogenase (short-subunit alcohol dehydrogenase family)